MLKLKENPFFFFMLLIITGTSSLNCRTFVFAADVIKVGVLLPLSGKLAMAADMEKKAFTMAVEDINGSGGIGDKLVDLVFGDTQAKPKAAVPFIDKMIREKKVSIVAGGFSSSVTWVCAQVAQQHKVPFLINTASADRITEQKWDYVFRLNTPFSEYGRSFASFMEETGEVRTAAIISESSLFGRFWSKRAVKQCQESGLKVILNEEFEPDAVDLNPLLSAVKSKEADLVYVIAGAEKAVLIALQARELCLGPKCFFGTNTGFACRDFQAGAGSASEYICAEALWAPTLSYPGVPKFYHEFYLKQGVHPDYHAAQAYAAMQVIADALKRAESVSPVDVRDALAATDMMTVYGPVRFTDYGKKTGQNRIPTYLIQWLSGNPETVWPAAAATARYVFPAPAWSQRRN